MKKSRFTEAQIMAILRQAEGGAPVAELCREHGISSVGVYKWRAKFGGMEKSHFQRHCMRGISNAKPFIGEKVPGPFPFPPQLSR